MRYFERNELIRAPDFAQEVKAKSGTDIDRCYQCLTCSLGCPVAFAMDRLPHQLVKMTQMGLRKAVLSSATIWVCANCEACATRCPNGIDLLGLMDTLREMALLEGLAEKEKAVIDFHHIFLGNIRRWGKQYELSLIMQFKLKTRDFLADLGTGIKMLFRGRLKLLPPRLKAPRGVRAIFQRTGSG
jgi:heterodisulfide reductase subunit C